MKKYFVAFFVLAVVGGGVYFLMSKNSVDSLPVRRENRQLPEVALRDYSGREVNFSSLRGTPVLLNLWASWCPYCKDEFRDFALIQGEFGDRVRIVAVNRGETQDAAKAFSDKFGLSDTLFFLLDSDDSLYKKIGGFSMPETLFIDKEGFILEHKRGPMNEFEMRRKIKEHFGI